MISHRKIQRQLYDYLRGECDEPRRREIEHHLNTCTTCRGELDTVRSSLELLGAQRRPADELPAEYWASFASMVDNRMRRQPSSDHRAAPVLQRFITDVLAHRRLAVSLGASLATIGLVVLLWRPWLPEHQPDAALTDGSVSPISIKPDKVSRYFRKSKMLLVGLSNLPTAEGEPIDLTVEQQVSRELVHDARSLQDSDLDPHSALVINDLEKILIELANMEQRRAHPQVELIRGGIQQQNLLFRLRMAETIRDSIQFVLARNNQ